MSFFDDFNLEIEAFSLGQDDIKIKKSTLNNILYQEHKQKIENYTLSSKINSFVYYNCPFYSTFHNLVFISFVGVNDLNEHCLFFIYGVIYDFNFIWLSIYFGQIKPVDDFKRTSLCITESYQLIVLYLNIDHELKVIIFNDRAKPKIEDEPIINNNINNNHYFSCLSLYEEIVIFIYFKEQNLILSIQNITSNYTINNYNDEFNDLIIMNIDQKYPISPLYNNNEAIKINSNKFVIISKYDSNKKLLILLFELYNKNEENIYKSINLRYYELSLDKNNIEINENFHIFLFKGLFGIYFFNNKNLFPGFMIFSYTKSINQGNEYDLLNNNYKIKINELIQIENNIFVYEPKLKILSLPDVSSTGIYLYNSDYEQIYENDTLDYKDSINIGFLPSSLIYDLYNISFVTISKEPSSFSTYNFYPNEIKTFGEEINQENYYINNIKEFECQESYFTFEISEYDLCDSSCKICNKNQCFSCIDSSEFPAELKKKCYSNISPPGNNYYFNNTINVFLLCHENCNSCNGSYDELLNNHNCIECKNGYIKMEKTNNCYLENEIPFSYYKSEDNIYKRCDRHCETCSGPSTNDGYHNCISCDIEENYILFNKSNNCLKCFSKNKIADFEQKKCIYREEVPDGYYLKDNLIVEKCYNNCKTCSNGEIIDNLNILNMNCDSCNNNNGYYFKEVENNNYYNCYLENEIPQNYYKRFDIEKNESKYYKCYELCRNCSEGGIENNMQCDSCYDDYELINGNCIPLIECPYLYIKNITNNNNKECLKENEICIDDYPFLFPKSNECKIICSYTQLIDKECISTKNSKALQEVHHIIIQKLKNNELILDNNNNFNDIIIEGMDTFYHLTTNINQNNNELNKKYSNLSSIELRECENKIKKNNNLPDDAPLFIFIVELIRNDTPSREVEYEIYNPYNLTINLDLSICKDTPIIIKSPILLNENKLKIYQNAKNQGYDIYNPNDTFYNDVCTPYDNENNIDVILNDRKNDYYENISLCESNCEYQEINVESKKVICSCEVKTEMNLIDYFSTIHFEPNKIKNDFFDVYKNSNLKIIKCYNLVLNLNNLKANIGSYLFIFLSFLFISSNIYTFFTIKQNIINIINKITKSNECLLEKESQIKNENSVNKKKVRKISSITKSHLMSCPPKSKKIQKIISKKSSNSIINNNNDTLSYFKNKDLDSPKNKRKKLKCKSSFHKPNSKSELVQTNLKFLPGNNKISQKELRNKKKVNRLSTNKFNISKKKKKDKNVNINDKTNKNFDFFIEKLLKVIKPEEKYTFLIDDELNHLIYKDALQIDFRTWMQYYWSLLKIKHLIIFTFINNEDYNVRAIKFSLFLCSFSIYFIVNTLFFNDDSIHKKYKNGGHFTINYQIIQILISSGISVVFNVLLKLLSLSQKNILKLKYLGIQEAKRESQKVYILIKLKFALFIIVGSCVLLFSWYYISCFCCVFKNSQNDLIKSITLSFIISMSYPMAISIIPGYLRNLSLKNRKKEDHKCLYDISKIISFI